MSQANMGVVRSIYAHWERGDFLSAPWAHPEIEYVMADGPSPGKWHGLAGMSSAGRANLDAWRELRFEAAEYHELDGERVLVIHRPSGKGKASGLEIGHTHSKCASLFQLRA